MAQTTHPHRQVHFSMLRHYQLADLITLGNGMAGAAAILWMMSYLTQPEAWRVYVTLGLIPSAMICDVLDGRVARWRHKNSLFGQELDSLADVVSFGVAPAALAYGLGLHGGLDCVALTFFVACGISRLARYNVTATALSDDAGKVKYFEGTPITSSVVLVVLLGVLFHFGLTGANLPLGVVRLGDLEGHPLAGLFFLNGCTMISKTLRIPKW